MFRNISLNVLHRPAFRHFYGSQKHLTRCFHVRARACSLLRTASKPKPPTSRKRACKVNALQSSALPLAPIKAAAAYLHQAGINVLVGTAPLLKLLCICSAIFALQSRQHLPDETTRGISMVLTNFAIPCLLFTTATQTVAQLHPSMLLTVVMLAAQVTVGWALGSLACRLVNNGALFGNSKFSWDVLNSTESSEIIASSTARAIGAPKAVTALKPKTPAIPPGLLPAVRMACAFGDPLLTPQLLSTFLLAPHLAVHQHSWAAALLLTWAMVFWGAVPAALQRVGRGAATNIGPSFTLGDAFRQFQRLVQNDDTPPPSELPPAPRPTALLPSTSSSRQLITPPGTPSSTSSTSGSMGGSESLWPPPFVLRLGSWVTQRLRQTGRVVSEAAVVNLPVAAVLAGLAFGCTTLCRNLLEVTPTHPPFLPWELRAVLLSTRSCFEGVEASGLAVVPLLGIMLGAAMGGEQTEGVPSLASTGRGVKSSAWAVLRAPLPPPLLRALVGVGVVRFVAVPLLSMALLLGAQMAAVGLTSQLGLTWGLECLFGAELGVWMAVVASSPPSEMLVATLGSSHHCSRLLMGQLSRLMLMWRAMAVLAAALWVPAFSAASKLLVLPV